MKHEFRDIPNVKTWKKISKINKGWSSDEKYYIEANDGSKMLLRISDISKYNSKKQEYESIRKLDEFDILMTRPIDFGVCNQNSQVYMIFTWVDGEDAEEVLPMLSLDKQYELGLIAGRYLRKMHQIPVPLDIPSWKERFNKKIDYKINMFDRCDIKFTGADKIIDYINKNRYLLNERKQTFQHGDYHIGNMVINQSGELVIIDFNRVDFGDPWEEFNRIVWSANFSPLFASGKINGYFKDNAPDEFFRLMALYIGSNQLASIPWAIQFGQKEIDVMMRQCRQVLQWYEDFESYIPNWYIRP
ncbi:phosphotransferase [Clostridiaceae bacterium M8S5]|nr:phosphotransferase [Clostridiaceae bacterium M8S5]